MAIRVQRSRAKGWRMPENTVYVGRGTQWENPFKVNNAMTGRLSRDESIRRYRYEIIQCNGGIVGFNKFWVQSNLRGRNLACWCPLDQPCHADVLLELANAPVTREADQR